MSATGFVIHEAEGVSVPDVCGAAVELVNSELGGSTMLSFAKLTVSGRSQSRRHHHQRTEEIYFFLNGRGRMALGDRIVHVRAGHAVFIPLGVVHQIFNEEPEDLVFVCADAPCFDPSDLFED